MGDCGSFVLLHHAKLSGQHKACFYLRGDLELAQEIEPSLSSSACSHAFPSFALCVNNKVSITFPFDTDLGTLGHTKLGSIVNVSSFCV